MKQIKNFFGFILFVVFMIAVTIFAIGFGILFMVFDFIQGKEYKTVSGGGQSW